MDKTFNAQEHLAKIEELKNAHWSAKVNFALELGKSLKLGQRVRVSSPSQYSRGGSVAKVVGTCLWLESNDGDWYYDKPYLTLDLRWVYGYTQDSGCIALKLDNRFSSTDSI